LDKKQFQVKHYWQKNKMEQPKNNFKIVADKNKARMLLPNMLTLIGVCIGLTSIRFALSGEFHLAIIAIIFAALIDGLDGRIARLIKGTSKVGKELDSLTDMISFGVAPAFIMYFWKLNTLGRFGWLLCLVYVICVALRLARFNINSNKESSWRDNFFEGVPSPAGGILVLTPLIISLSGFNYIELNYEIITPVFFITTSFLLISKFPSYSFKKIVIQRKATIFLLFGIILFFGLLLIYTFEVISISSIIYLSLLPISYFHYQKLKKNNENDKIQEDEDLEDVL
jgi:CDP-diacylglycerol--serine O-phosphatidyltransferase